MSVPTPSVGRNIAASAFGNAWTAIVQIAFVPVYIGLLGVEAYGLIGIHAFLQATLVLLDLGLAAVLGRESARTAAGVGSIDRLRELLRSAEVALAAVALAVGTLLVLAAPHAGASWLRLDAVSRESAAFALSLMGVLVALRIFSGLHRGIVTGFQQLPWLNAVSAGFATLRAVGVIGVLMWHSRTIEAFFAFQLAVTVVETGVLAAKAWSLMPSAGRPQFSIAILREVRRYSGGAALIGGLYVIVSQADKVILSALLPLASFGYYALASSVAAALNLLFAPVAATAFPRITELVARGDEREVAGAFHGFAQLVALAVAPAAIVLALFAEPVLALWTRDAATTAATAPLLALLAVGALLNAFMSIPLMIPLARGRTRGLVATSAFLVVAFIPALWFAVSAGGAVAAAWVWLAIHGVGVLLVWPLLRSELRTAEILRWIVRDVALPVLAALAAAGAVRIVAGSIGGQGDLGRTVTILAAAAAAFLAAALAIPDGRRVLARLSGSKA